MLLATDAWAELITQTIQTDWQPPAGPHAAAGGPSPRTVLGETVRL